LLSRSHSEYVEGTTLLDMITEDLVAERIAIDSYQEIAAYFADFDSTTRRMIEEIQASEEEHADDLAELIEGLPKSAAVQSARVCPRENDRPAALPDADMAAHHGVGSAPDAARQRAAQLYPAVASRLALKRDANRADALLLADYGLAGPTAGTARRPGVAVLVRASRFRSTRRRQ
jgi:Ferritin-like domain